MAARWRSLASRLCSGLLHQLHSYLVFLFLWKRQPWVERESVLPDPGKRLTYTQREVPTPHAKRDSTFSQFNWSKNHCPDLSKYSFSDCSVKILRVIELCSSDRMGKTSVLLIEILVQALLYKGWLMWQNTVLGGSSVQASP